MRGWIPRLLDFGHLVLGRHGALAGVLLELRLFGHAQIVTGGRIVRVRGVGLLEFLLRLGNFPGLQEHLAILDHDVDLHLVGLKFGHLGLHGLAGHPPLGGRRRLAKLLFVLLGGRIARVDPQEAIHPVVGLDQIAPFLGLLGEFDAHVGEAAVEALRLLFHADTAYLLEEVVSVVVQLERPGQIVLLLGGLGLVKLPSHLNGRLLSAD